MQGKDAGDKAACLDLGITPAYAGKRPGFSGPFLPTGDHPRVCREKLFIPDTENAAVGSPPPVRGKGDAGLKQAEEDRITPAYAGKSRQTCGPCEAQGDHPRLCGEKMAGIRQMPKCSGSPPRVRGKGGDGLSHAALEGITPAYAGKRKPPPDRHKNWGDHPRMCGEKSSKDAGKALQLGSPPRVRGKVPSSI